MEKVLSPSVLFKMLNGTLLMKQWSVPHIVLRAEIKPSVGVKVDSAYHQLHCPVPMNTTEPCDWVPCTISEESLGLLISSVVQS